MSKSLGNVIDPIHVIEGRSLEQLQQTLSAGNLDINEQKKYTMDTPFYSLNYENVIIEKILPSL
jgi:valyl-tRNA synthetase